jgi:pimeloyl-ACP methyl ester carboxylesterase
VSNINLNKVMEYTPEQKQRFSELKISKNGKLAAEWSLTDTKMVEAVTLAIPPAYSIPIIFVPGIMGSNLCDLKNRPVWLLNSIRDLPISLAMNWSRKDAGARQAILHPDKTKVYTKGALPRGNPKLGHTQLTYAQRGWGEVSEASYHGFLLWLEEKMNGARNPAAWDDFAAHSQSNLLSADAEKVKKLQPGTQMKMQGLPDISENGIQVDQIKWDDLLKRAKATFPVYAFGYNWLASNKDAAELLNVRIEQVIKENNVGQTKCSKVILVTHSMGGLVARACCRLPGVSKKVLGVVHGVMPATGAAVAYRRCKVGMADEDMVSGFVIGSSGKEVTAVFAQSPGALQLLPSEDYGKHWLEICGPSGKIISTLPLSDPYKEIYMERDKWWGLVSEDWLKPHGGKPIDWDVYSLNIDLAKEFHRGISRKYHEHTFVFYGGGPEKGSCTNIRWNIRPGGLSLGTFASPSLMDICKMSRKFVKTDGSNNLYIDGKMSAASDLVGADAKLATSYWSIQCRQPESSGDGTVPAISGRDPLREGGKNVIQQFELSGIKHEAAYRDYSVARQVAYYAITKLAAMADFS